MNQTERKQLLLSVVMQLVEKELAGQGLRTFGALLGEGREVQLLVPKAIKEKPTLDDIDKDWMEQLRSSISSGQFHAACYCLDIRVVSGEGELLTPGVVVFVEQAGANAEYRFYPYEKRHDSTVVMRDPTVEETPLRLFTSAQRM